MHPETRMSTIDQALHDAITRLGRGASRAETSAVRDGITSLFYSQGHVTVAQSSVIVHTAVLTHERRNLK